MIGRAMQQRVDPGNRHGFHAVQLELAPLHLGQFHVGFEHILLCDLPGAIFRLRRLAKMPDGRAVLGIQLFLAAGKIIVPQRRASRCHEADFGIVQIEPRRRRFGLCLLTAQISFARPGKFLRTLDHPSDVVIRVAERARPHCRRKLRVFQRNRPADTVRPRLARRHSSRPATDSAGAPRRPAHRDRALADRQTDRRRKRSPASGGGIGGDAASVGAAIFHDLVGRRDYTGTRRAVTVLRDWLDGCGGWRSDDWRRKPCAAATVRRTAAGKADGHYEEQASGKQPLRCFSRLREHRHPILAK